MSEKVAYLLKEKEKSRKTIEMEGRGITTPNIVDRGVTLDDETAKKWEKSRADRVYIELPIIKAVEKKAYDFQPIGNSEEDN